MVEAAGVGITAFIENNQVIEKSDPPKHQESQNWAKVCTWTSARNS